MRISRSVRDVQSQQERLTNILETLRLSFEKSSEDMYRRLTKLETDQNIIQGRLHQLEKYTGLRSNLKISDVSSSIDSMKEKDFS